MQNVFSYGILLLDIASKNAILNFTYSTGESYTKKQHFKQFQIAAILRRGIVVELTKPKSALLFFAFLPQFIDPKTGAIAMRLVLLQTVYALMAFGSDIVVAMLSGKLGQWLAHYKNLTLWQERFSGSVLITLGGFISYQELLKDAVE